MHATSRAPSVTRASTRPLVLLALTQTGLFLVPIIVLGQAIGWPGSLRLPPAEVFALISAAPTAVAIGYGAYLLVSLALVPFAFALRDYLARHGAGGWLSDTMLGLGVVAGVLKMLGIVRWLVAMPALAAVHAGGDASTRAMAEVAYVALNGYAGAVGELLGVQLVSGLWLAGIGLLLARVGHRWVGLIGAAIGVGFIVTAGRILVPALAAAQSIMVPLALIWFVALAVVVARRR
jgi:hypothetical protein